MKKIENIPGHQKQCSEMFWLTVTQKISYLLLQLHVQRYMLFTANFECFYIYITNSKEK